MTDREATKGESHGRKPCGCSWHSDRNGVLTSKCSDYPYCPEPMGTQGTIVTTSEPTSACRGCGKPMLYSKHCDPKECSCGCHEGNYLCPACDIPAGLCCNCKTTPPPSGNAEDDDELPPSIPPKIIGHIVGKFVPMASEGNASEVDNEVDNKKTEGEQHSECGSAGGNQETTPVLVPLMAAKGSTGEDSPPAPKPTISEDGIHHGEDANYPVAPSSHYVRACDCPKLDCPIHGEQPETVTTVSSSNPQAEDDGSVPGLVMSEELAAKSNPQAASSDSLKTSESNSEAASEVEPRGRRITMDEAREMALQMSKTADETTRRLIEEEAERNKCFLCKEKDETILTLQARNAELLYCLDCVLRLAKASLSGKPYRNADEVILAAERALIDSPPTE